MSKTNPERACLTEKRSGTPFRSPSDGRSKSAWRSLVVGDAAIRGDRSECHNGRRSETATTITTRCPGSTSAYTGSAFVALYSSNPTLKSGFDGDVHGTTKSYIWCRCSFGTADAVESRIVTGGKPRQHVSKVNVEDRPPEEPEKSLRKGWNFRDRVIFSTMRLPEVIFRASYFLWALFERSKTGC